MNGSPRASGGGGGRMRAGGGGRDSYPPELEDQRLVPAATVAFRNRRLRRGVAPRAGPPPRAAPRGRSSGSGGAVAARALPGRHARGRPRRRPGSVPPRQLAASRLGLPRRLRPAGRGGVARLEPPPSRAAGDGGERRGERLPS